MRFSSEITNFFVELIQQNEADLFPNSIKKNARETSIQAWQSVYNDLINAYPTSGISLEHCKSKWKELKKQSKKDAQEAKR